MAASGEAVLSCDSIELRDALFTGPKRSWFLGLAPVGTLTLSFLTWWPFFFSEPSSFGSFMAVALPRSWEASGVACAERIVWGLAS